MDEELLIDDKGGVNGHPDVPRGNGGADVGQLQAMVLRVQSTPGGIDLQRRCDQGRVVSDVSVATSVLLVG